MVKAKIWFHTLVSYNEFGNPTIIKSFTTVAKDSDIKQSTKAKPKSIHIIKSEEEELF